MEVHQISWSGHGLGGSIKWSDLKSDYIVDKNVQDLRLDSLEILGQDFPAFLILSSENSREPFNWHSFLVCSVHNRGLLASNQHFPRMQRRAKVKACRRNPLFYFLVAPPTNRVTSCQQKVFINEANKWRCNICHRILNLNGGCTFPLLSSTSPPPLIKIIHKRKEKKKKRDFFLSWLSISLSLHFYF